MKRLALVLGIFAAVAVPAITFAQSTSAAALLAEVAQLQQALQSLGQSSPTAPAASTAPASETGGVCPVFSRTLGVGASGSDVANLQAFLAGQGLFHAGITAYFGSITQAAVQEWQEAHGIVSGGSAASTGFGVVGPRTSAAITQSCGGQASSSQGVTSCIPTSPPTSECSTGWQPVTDSYGCTTSYQCSIPLPGSTSCSAGFTYESGQCVESMCTAITLMCPTGEYDQTGANCSQTCVSNTATPSTNASCPVYEIPTCPTGYSAQSEGAAQNGCALAEQCVLGTGVSGSLFATPQSGTVPLTVSFSAATQGNYSNEIISFGDGTAAVLQPGVCTNSVPISCTASATHTYSVNGSYTATLYSGGTTFGTVSITVNGSASQ